MGLILWLHMVKCTTVWNPDTLTIQFETFLDIKNLSNLILAVEPLSRRVSVDWQFIFKKNVCLRLLKESSWFRHFWKGVGNRDATVMPIKLTKSQKIVKGSQKKKKAAKANIILPSIWVSNPALDCVALSSSLIHSHPKHPFSWLISPLEQCRAGAGPDPPLPLIPPASITCPPSKNDSEAHSSCKRRVCGAWEQDGLKYGICWMRTSHILKEIKESEGTGKRSGCAPVSWPVAGCSKSWGTEICADRDGSRCYGQNQNEVTPFRLPWSSCSDSTSQNPIRRQRVN